MPSANLAAYLAKNYLTASTSSPDHLGSNDFQDSTRPKKKRRRDKDQAPETGLIIADDDEALTLKGNSNNKRADDEDGDTPMYETGVKSAEFRKKKGGIGWKVVSQPEKTSSTTTMTNTKGGAGDAEAEAEADRILASAAEEADARRREIGDEDAPAIVENVDVDMDHGDQPRMSSGAKAGLQTAADTALMMERENEREERERERERDQKGSKSRRKKNNAEEVQVQEEETIYRDATGRRIDISMKRAEARAAEEEKRRAERQARQDAMGDVQRREREARRQDLEEAKFLTVARGAEDQDMNEELKRAVRWDDPMAAYVAQQRAKKDGPAGTHSAGTVAEREQGGKTKTKTRVYAGAAPPNRYGIPPGWRWDGVDRANGFEKEWFQARSRKGRNAELEYQWQMDDARSTIGDQEIGGQSMQGTKYKYKYTTDEQEKWWIGYEKTLHLGAI
ncbi:Pre-mRNA-splicing factor cwc26 [Exophiala xenobiotica]|uniref:Pre-mRNA-splicing factor cwc26 n=1 Tax=Vermiconidia calcicola TaxID=1690605 RepID=A0AAV9QQ51_9PEZI|nr:Pre-mRNA-splicing factor cwc26 [Exophiala xenobiotica]KAK5545650.1 Pre-mRNA-splicing factor cwc26 [Vermiconidia calcicola]KAK5550090.1 Pre-mRNA-splicing factor cwc26 [Chaetothyriales sp. CCFEE 6169]KAK5271754.1 Pre-mRNA-splicing factor cwc26 [Exophiala xenobiotica]KAK5308115.1 Pre-mRNA-splicing factor cwc26 [Exophiala xenobiotica]